MKEQKCVVSFCHYNSTVEQAWAGRELPARPRPFCVIKCWAHALRAGLPAHAGSNGECVHSRCIVMPAQMKFLGGTQNGLSLTSTLKMCKFSHVLCSSKYILLLYTYSNVVVAMADLTKLP